VESRIVRRATDLARKALNAIRGSSGDRPRLTMKEDAGKRPRDWKALVARADSEFLGHGGEYATSSLENVREQTLGRRYGDKSIALAERSGPLPLGPLAGAVPLAPVLARAVVSQQTGDTERTGGNTTVDALRRQVLTSLFEAHLRMVRLAAEGHATMPRPNDAPEVMSAAREMEDHRLLRPIVERIERLEAAVLERRFPTRFIELQDRVRSAMNRESTSRHSHLVLPSSTALRQHLRERSFLLPIETVESLRVAIEHSQLVVLEGVPGTGKSRLARLLAEIVLQGGAECYRFEAMTPDTRSEDIVGGRTFVDGHVGPGLGCLTDAVLRCYERAGGVWLVLDELNRGNADAALSPILDALSGQGGSICHPFIFPQSQHEEANLSLPGRFRIIGTMNALDVELYCVSHALRRRMAVVKIPILDYDDEKVLLEERISDSRQMTAQRGLPNLGGAVEGMLVRQVLEFAARLRRVSGSGSSAEYAAAAFGAAPLLRVLDSVISIITAEVRSEQEVAGLLDAAATVFLAPLLSSCGTRALRDIVAEIESEYPATAARLRESIESRSVV
jgi:MoxR-like ATPase